MRYLALVFVLLAVGCSGRNAEKFNEEGKVALQRKDLKTAVASFGQAVQLQPDNPTFRYNSGLALARAGLYQQAITELETAIRLNPSDVEARRTLGRVQARVASDRAQELTDAVASAH